MHLARTFCFSLRLNSILVIVEFERLGDYAFVLNIPTIHTYFL